MSYRRILVPVDGSPTSNKALVAATELVRDRNGQIRLMYAFDELTLAMNIEYAGNVIQAARQEAEKALSDGLAIVRAAGIQGDTHLVEARGKRLGETVADEAVAWEADLVVVGTHGRRGFSRMLLGSGAESVIRTSNVPVLVVRGDEKS